MEVVYDYDTKELVKFALNGKDIKDDDRIRFAITEGFHLNGFNSNFDIDITEIEKNMKPRRVTTSILSIFEEMLSQRKEFDAEVEGRIIILNRPQS